MTYLIAYLSTTIVFFVIDFIWLGTIAKDFYHKQLGDLLLDKFNIPVAIGFYLIYVIGIVYFAILPALQSGQWQTALINGALLGFFCYATYDLTNLATLKDWPVKMAVVDMIWGTFLTAGSAVGGYFLTQFWAK